MHETVDRFAESLAARATPATVLGYHRLLEQLADFAETRRPSARVSDLDVHLMRAFLATKAGAGPAAIARAITAMRGFLRWAHRAGDVARNLALDLVPPRVPRALPDVVNVDLVVAMLDAPSPPTPEGLRDRAMLELLYASGLHLGELVALEVDHVDLTPRHDGLGTVHIEGVRARDVPLGRRALAALRDYVERRGELAGARVDPRALFVARRGRLSAAGARRVVQRGITIGTGSRHAPTVLRHSCAAHLLDGGADLRVVQILLGHRRIGSTCRYLSVAIDHLVRVYDAAHPLARRPPVDAR